VINSWTPDGTSGIYLWGADLRVTDDGVGIPAYQRVGAATAGSSTAAGTADYDSTGFPPYLRFDGTDDSMATSAIDFTATDAITVFSGVRKLSDAAQGMIAELSVETSSFAGSFAILSPGTNATANYRWRVGGTTNVNNVSASSFAAPVTNVLTAIGNISGDSAILRANGSETINSTADQGTGNFGNYALFIGSRNNVGFRYNGRLYSLIALGRTATADEITNTETWVNGKTKAYA
jgi:hypothetical protein